MTCFEPLEPRIALDASGFPGNDCPPDLDLSTVPQQTIVAGQTLSLNLFTAGATVEDLDGTGASTGDAIRLQLDPDVPEDTPAGASLTEAGDFTWTPSLDQIGTHSIIVIGVDQGVPPLADAETFMVKVNDPNVPVVDLNGPDAGDGFSSTFVEDAGAVEIVDRDLTIVDADNTTLASARVVLTNRPNGNAESLAVDTAGTSMAANYDGATGELIISGTDTLANYQQVLRTLEYSNLSQDPDTTERIVEVTVNDGAKTSDAAISTVTIVARNDAPNLSLPAPFNAEEPVKHLLGESISFTASTFDPDHDDSQVFYILDLDNSGIPRTAVQPNITSPPASIPGGQFTWTPDTEGTFVLTILAIDNLGLSDQENFTIVVADILEDASEPNDSFGQATDTGVGPLFLTDHTIDIEGDEDFFLWTAYEEGVLDLSLLFDDELGDLTLNLFDSSRSLLSTVNSPTDDERLYWPVQTGESYFLSVHSDFGTQPSYDLSASVVSPILPEELGIEFLPEPQQIEPGILLLGTGLPLSDLRLLRPDNAAAAQSINTDDLHVGGSLNLSLDGTGLTVGVWDEGRVHAGHQEFAGRVTFGDTSARVSDHSTHVAGTIGATGVPGNLNARGMAPNVDIQSFDWNNDVMELSANAANLVASNHSYGFAAGWAGPMCIPMTTICDDTWIDDRFIGQEDRKFGKYDAISQSFDQALALNDNLLTLVSAGNERLDAQGIPDLTYLTLNGAGMLFLMNAAMLGGLVPPNGDGQVNAGFDTLPSGNKLAKNVLTVGAVDDVTGAKDPTTIVQVGTSFSSWGPADDGRIKPDVVANGELLTSPVGTNSAGVPCTGLSPPSTTLNNRYLACSGTSMATPSVTGTAVLLAEHHQDLFSTLPRGATLKGLLIHTATEAGPNPGPDYQHGWGLVDANEAARLLSNSPVPQAGQSPYEFTYTSPTLHRIEPLGDAPIKVTIVWNDPAPTTLPGALLDDSTTVLVNDLDLSILGPDATTHFPWALNPAQPAAAAVRQRNSVDNVEQVVVDAPVSGIYTIEINNSGPAFSQNYSMFVSGARRPRIDFYEGNGASQDLVCGLNVAVNQTINFQQHAACDNDEARSLIMYDVPAGRTFRLFDSPSGDRQDDWVEIHTKRDIRSQTVASFEQSFEDDDVRITYHRNNGLDGKVSRFEVSSIQTGPWVDLYEGNGASQNLVCGLNVAVNQTINFQQHAACDNDEARSLTLYDVPAGRTFRLFDSPSGDRQDDWVEIHAKRDIRSHTVASFEQSFEDDDFRMTYHRNNGLDGKVSRFEVSSIQTGPWVDLYEGNGASQNLVCGLNVAVNQTINFQQHAACDNDEARSLTLYDVPAGRTFRLFDSPSGDTGDDWIQIDVLQPVTRYVISTFERNISDGIVRVRYFRNNGLDGKVSRMQMSPTTSEPGTAPFFEGNTEIDEQTAKLVEDVFTSLDSERALVGRLDESLIDLLAPDQVFAKST